jgi:uncharacterized Zn finger protein
MCPNCGHPWCDKLHEIFDNKNNKLIMSWRCESCGHVFKTDEQLNEMLREINSMPPEDYVVI